MSRFLSPALSAVTPYTPGEQPQDQQYIKLNTNESPYLPSPRVVAAVSEAEVEKLRLYSDPACAQLLRTAAAHFGLQPSQVMPGNGSDENLFFALRAFCDESHPLAFADITYGCYGVWCGLLHIPTHIIPLKEELAALKKNTHKFDKLQIAAFSDDCRDGVKGHVFYEEEAGFVNGRDGLEETIKFAVVASTSHEGVDKNNIIYSEEFWANEPYQTVNYASAHDNYTLWDKLKLSTVNCREEELIAMNKLIAGIILTSQGISFIHAGEEMARTKVDKNGNLVENSFESPDEVNKICWDRKIKYRDLCEYYKGLISLRKNYKAFRMDTNEEIQRNIKFLEIDKNFKENNVVAYIIDSKNIDSKCNKIAVIINANDEDIDVFIDNDNWSVLVNEEVAGTSIIEKVEGNKVNVHKKSIKILIK